MVHPTSRSRIPVRPVPWSMAVRPSWGRSWVVCSCVCWVVVCFGLGCVDMSEGRSAPAPRLGQLSGPGPAPDDALVKAIAQAGGNVLGALQLLEVDASRRRAGRPGGLESDLPLVQIVEGDGGTVRELYLQGIYITDEGLSKLADVNGLERLHLHKAPVSDAGLEHLSRFPNLTGLSLGRLDVTDRGLAHLARFQSLRRLVVEGPRISTAGVERIASLSQLEGLGLSGLGITDEAIEPISGLVKLRLLSLSGTAVGDDGLVHLAKLPRLTVLNLSDTRVSDAGLPALEQLGTLKLLRLDGTRVTDAGVASLRRELPGCKIAVRLVQSSVPE
jgi:hypothetical protein